MKRSLSTGRVAALAVVAAMLAACGQSEPPASPTDLRPMGAFASTTFDGAVFACKAGGPAGTYTFQGSQSGGGDGWFPYGTTQSVNFDGTNIACVHMWSPLNEASWGAGVTGTVTISEINLPANIEVDVIKVWDSRNQVFLPDVTGQNYVDITVTHDNNLFYAKIYNKEVEAPPPPPPPPHGDGCTPGYWKVPVHWDSWIPTGLSPSQQISTVFANASLYNLGGYTLVQGLSFKGGSTLEGAAQILLRAAIAAALNSLSPGVDYAETYADVVSQVNAALASGDRATMIGLAGGLDYYNNLGCTLD